MHANTESLLAISQNVLSREGKLTFHTVAKIEVDSTSNPTAETVKKLADTLGVSPDD